MHLKSLSIATVIPVASARIYLSGEEQPDFGDGPALMMLPVGGEDANQGDGEIGLPSISNVSLNPDGSNPEPQPLNGEEFTNPPLPNTGEGFDLDTSQISNTPWWMNDKSAGEGEITVNSTNEDIQQPVAVNSTKKDAQQQPTLYSSDIIGPTWECTEYYNADQDSLIDHFVKTTITIEFEADKQFDGHSDCNSYGGIAEHGKSSFHVAGPIRSTLMMCEEDVCDQEFNYLAIFELGTINWIISKDGRSLELCSSEDSVLAKYKIFDPLIVGTTWKTTSYYDSTQDAMMDLINSTEITLNVELNKRFDGTAGCNNYIGPYDDLTTTSFAGTSVDSTSCMLCGEQARMNTATSIMSQEDTYLANFAKSRVIDWAILDNGTLELKDDGKGSMLATYEAGLEFSEESLPANETEQSAETLLEDKSSAMNFGTAVAPVGTVVAALLVLHV